MSINLDIQGAHFVGEVLMRCTHTSYTYIYIYIYVSFRISESPTGLRLQDVDRDLCPWVSHVMDPQVLVEPRLCPRMALVFRRAERPNFKMATEVITNHQTLGENSRKKHRKRSKIIKLWGKYKKKTSKTISKKIKLWGKLKKKRKKQYQKRSNIIKHPWWEWWTQWVRPSQACLCSTSLSSVPNALWSSSAADGCGARNHHFRNQKVVI